MESVEVKLLKYTFRFKPLLWREEFGIKFGKDEDRLRVFLAYALEEVSGIKVKTVAEAKRVLSPIPSSVIQRVFVIYKGSIPEQQMFSTVGLYKAPEPKNMAMRFAAVEKETEQVMDRVEEEMAAKFGRKELEEARELERTMAKNSKMRGATKTTPDVAPEPKKNA
jgi:hypothetical protein